MIHTLTIRWSFGEGECYLTAKTEDLTCFISYMPVLQGHGPLKYHEENFGPIQVPDKTLVFTPHLFAVKYGKNYFDLEKMEE